MRKYQGYVFIGIFACISLFFVTMASGYSENDITVKATVYGAAWNEKGEVTSVSLLTVEGDELFVVHTPVGDELLKLVEQNVKANGAVLVGKDGRKDITVYKYEILYN